MYWTSRVHQARLQVQIQPESLPTSCIQETIKREVSQYTILKDEMYFEAFKRNLLVTATTHDCEEILNGDYKPESNDDSQAHSQQGFDFKVLGHNLSFFNFLRFWIPKNKLRFGVFCFASGGGWKCSQGILSFVKTKSKLVKTGNLLIFFIQIPCEMSDPCLIQLVPAIMNPFYIC